jgi:hypothetical protein
MRRASSAGVGILQASLMAGIAQVQSSDLSNEFDSFDETRWSKGDHNLGRSYPIRTTCARGLHRLVGGQGRHSKARKVVCARGRSPDRQTNASLRGGLPLFIEMGEDAFSKTPITWACPQLNVCQSLLVESSFMADTRSKNLPENVDLVVLDGSGVLQTDVGLEELPYHMSDSDTLIWCDIASTQGGARWALRAAPAGGLRVRRIDYRRLLH